MTKQTEKHQDEQGVLYEIGYLVVPTVAEEQLPGVVQEIKKTLEKHKGVISKEGEPILRDLAYELVKVSVGKRQKFNRAYFGWVTFTAMPSDAPAIEKEVGAMDVILRHIFIKTEDDVIIEVPLTMSAPDKTDDAVVPEAKTSVEEIDKKIDNLVVV